MSGLVITNFHNNLLTLSHVKYMLYVIIFETVGFRILLYNYTNSHNITDNLRQRRRECS